MGGYVARETRTPVRYFLGAIPLPYLLKITSTPLTYLLKITPVPTLSRPLTTNKSHNHAIYKGWGVFTSTIGNTLYNHLPSSNNRIVSYIYTNSNLLTCCHQLPLTKSPYLPINTTPLPWNHLKIIERYIVKPTKLLGFKGICYQKHMNTKFPKP